MRNSWAIHETSPDPGGLPRYPIKTVILLSFGLLLLQALSQLLKQVDAIRGVDGAAEDRPTESEPKHEGHL